MEPGLRNKGSQALQEFHGRHEDMPRPITERGFEVQDNLAGWVATQPFVAKGGTSDVGTETFEGMPQMKSARHVGM